MKRVVFILFLLLAFIFTMASENTIAIFDYDDRLDQPDTLAKYIEEMIKTQIPDTGVDQFSGKGDDVTARAVMTKIDTGQYRVIILITSDAVIIAKHSQVKTPTLFANANNPLGLGFSTLKAPGGTMSGASYYVPVEKKLSFFKKISPGIKKIGFLFDDTNKSRDIEVSETRTACSKLGLEFNLVLIKEKGELKEAVQKLLAKGVDSVVITTSSVLYSNISEFYTLCVAANVPLFSFHTTGVTNGAIASLGVDYNVLAEKELMPMIKDVIAGKNPGAMDIRFISNPDIYLNLKSARDIDLVVSEEIIMSAKKVLK